MPNEFMSEEATETKICGNCNVEKNLVKFAFAKNGGKVYRMKNCRKCYADGKVFIKVIKRPPFEINGEWFKVCSTCKSEKKLDEFAADKRNKSGVGANCKNCANARGRVPPKPVYVDVKPCVKCGMEKPLFSFGKYKKKDGETGYTAKCNTCKNNKPKALHRHYQKGGIWFKFCSGCRFTKFLDSFNKKGKGYGYCKTCQSRKSSADIQKSSPERKQKKVQCGKKYAALPTTRKRRREKAYEKYHSDPIYRKKKLKSKEGYMTPEKRRRYYLKYGSKYTQAYRAKKFSAEFVIRFTKEEIIKRDGLACYLCEKKLNFKTAVIEHLIPISRGGNHKPENVRLACKPCNSTKINKTVTEFKKWRGDYDRFKINKAQI